MQQAGDGSRPIAGKHTSRAVQRKEDVSNPEFHGEECRRGLWMAPAQAWPACEGDHERGEGGERVGSGGSPASLDTYLVRHFCWMFVWEVGSCDGWMVS